MAANDREVFDKLAGAEDDRTPINYITYALFAFERREFIGHFENMNGRPPEQADIDAWTANFTDSQFASLKGEAAAFFDRAARSYMEDEVEAARQETLQGAVVREVVSATDAQKAGLAATLAEVKAAGTFRKQFSIALLTSILAPLLIGSAIGAFLVFSDRFPSIRDIVAASAARKPEPRTPASQTP